VPLDQWATGDGREISDDHRVSGFQRTFQAFEQLDCRQSGPGGQAFALTFRRFENSRNVEVPAVGHEHGSDHR
jgi:hypothetical protein